MYSKSIKIILILIYYGRASLNNLDITRKNNFDNLGITNA